ncbi:MAG: NAD(P)H-hydrate epimerase [Deltaproteobacteria bacterium]|nr:NAD(P)H-hydrate epimerase [Deltaproteobacteria bacterium]
MAIAVLSADEIRRIDKQSIEEIGIPGCVLMEVAGRAVAETAEALIVDEGRVLVVCGKGNNGGDGFVAARHLLTHGHEVSCALLGETDALQGDAAQNAQIFTNLGGVITACLDEDAIDSLAFDDLDLVVDALFGIGLSKDVTGLYAQVIDRMNASTAPLIAVDMPSGVSADTGQILGRGLRADVTVTFGAPKRGQLFFPGADLCGDLHVVDIGLPPQAFEDKGLSLWLLAEHDIAEYLTLRAPDAHKGDFGHLLVLAGSLNKPGAAGLCVEAGLRGGAGLVTLAAPLPVLQQVIAGPSDSHCPWTGPGARA